MTPEIVSRDEFIVVGVRTVLDFGEQSADTLWKDKFIPRRGELAVVDGRCYCVFSMLSEEGKDPGRVEYVAGMVTNSLENIPVGMVGWVIPSGTYAEMSATGQTGIGQACRELIADWLPDSGYTLVAGPIYASTDSPQPDSPEAVWKINVPIETPERLAQLGNWLE